jgi:hypothetical protein
MPVLYSCLDFHVISVCSCTVLVKIGFFFFCGQTYAMGDRLTLEQRRVVVSLMGRCSCCVVCACVRYDC